MTDKLVQEMVVRAELMKLAAQYRPGQVLTLAGFKVRVIQVDPPNEYRSYALVDFEPLQKGLVPARAVARLDGAGLHFRVPEGWRDGAGNTDQG